MQYDRAFLALVMKKSLKIILIFLLNSDILSYNLVYLLNYETLQV